MNIKELGEIVKIIENESKSVNDPVGALLAKLRSNRSYRKLVGITMFGLREQKVNVQSLRQDEHGIIASTELICFSMGTSGKGTFWARGDDQRHGMRTYCGDQSIREIAALCQVAIDWWKERKKESHKEVDPAAKPMQFTNEGGWGAMTKQEVADVVHEVSPHAQDLFNQACKELDQEAARVCNLEPDTYAQSKYQQLKANAIADLMDAEEQRAAKLLNDPPVDNAISQAMVQPGVAERTVVVTTAPATPSREELLRAFTLLDRPSPILTREPGDYWEEDENGVMFLRRKSGVPILMMSKADFEHMKKWKEEQR